MKRFALCLLVLVALALPEISLAEPDLSGNWSLKITSIDPEGNMVSQSTTMVLNPSTSPGFYYGTVVTDASFITVVQEGGNIRFTISCTNDLTSGCGATPSGHRTRTWGSGIAGKKRIDVTWSDDIGLTGIGEAVR